MVFTGNYLFTDSPLQRMDWPLSGKPETLPGLSKRDWYLICESSAMGEIWAALRRC